MNNNESTGLIVTSSSFEEGGMIPSKYTCDGDGVNPPLHIANIPHGCQTLAIITEDPDAPDGVFDHWLVWNITRTDKIKENAIQGICGRNGAGKTGYHGPCPPTGYHRYFFYIFALDTHLYLEPGENKEKLKEAMKSHILAKGHIMGRYQKVNNYL